MCKLLTAQKCFPWYQILFLAAFRVFDKSYAVLSMPLTWLLLTWLYISWLDSTWLVLTSHAIHVNLFIFLPDQFPIFHSPFSFFIFPFYILLSPQLFSFQMQPIFEPVTFTFAFSTNDVRTPGLANLSCVLLRFAFPLSFLLRLLHLLFFLSISIIQQPLSLSLTLSVSVSQNTFEILFLLHSTSIHRFHRALLNSSCLTHNNFFPSSYTSILSAALSNSPTRNPSVRPTEPNYTTHAHNLIMHTNDCCNQLNAHVSCHYLSQIVASAYRLLIHSIILTLTALLTLNVTLLLFNNPHRLWSRS